MVGAGITVGSAEAEAQSELITLTLMVGGILLAARLFRLGSIVENVEQATLIGLKIGVGLAHRRGRVGPFGVTQDQADDGCRMGSSTTLTRAPIDCGSSSDKVPSRVSTSDMARRAITSATQSGSAVAARPA